VYRPFALRSCMRSDVLMELVAPQGNLPQASSPF
jgi:hypothetical protein